MMRAFDPGLAEERDVEQGAGRDCLGRPSAPRNPASLAYVRDLLDLSGQRRRVRRRARAPDLPDVRPRYFSSSGFAPGAETDSMRNASPSRTQIVPLCCRVNSTAEATTASNTACRSKAERLMTFKTSAVAVCCCSASLKIARSRLYLVEQPGVLERDDGLIGECLYEFDLALSDGPVRGRLITNTPLDPVVSQ